MSFPDWSTDLDFHWSSQHVSCSTHCKTPPSAPHAQSGLVWYAWNQHKHWEHSCGLAALSVAEAAHDSKTLSQAAGCINAESKAHVTHSSGFLDDQPDQLTAKASVSRSELIRSVAAT